MNWLPCNDWPSLCNGWQCVCGFIKEFFNPQASGCLLDTKQILHGAGGENNMESLLTPPNLLSQQGDIALIWKKWRACFLAYFGAVNQEGYLTKTWEVNLFGFITWEKAWDFHIWNWCGIKNSARSLGKIWWLLCA
jgi:hypothetical protein